MVTIEKKNEAFLKIRADYIPDAVPASEATEVQQIYVDELHQRKGVGGRLMDQAVAVARQRGHEGIWLSVWQEADWAVGFYEAYGFHAVGTTVFQLGAARYTDNLMWLPIND